MERLSAGQKDEMGEFELSGALRLKLGTPVEEA